MKCFVYLVTIVILLSYLKPTTPIKTVPDPEYDEIQPIEASARYLYSPYSVSRPYIIDKNLETKITVSSDTGNSAWIKLKFDSTYFIEKVVIYSQFFTDYWNSSVGCNRNVISFKDCIDGRQVVFVSVYDGIKEVKQCGIWRPTYNLTQDGQIYTIGCQLAQGDTIILRKDFRKEISVSEIVVTGFPTRVPEPGPDDPNPWIPAVTHRFIAWNIAVTPLEILSTTTNTTNFIQVTFYGHLGEQLRIFWNWNWEVKIDHCDRFTEPGTHGTMHDVPNNQSTAKTYKRFWRIEKWDTMIQIYCNHVLVYRKRFSDCYMDGPRSRTKWSQQIVGMKFGSSNDDNSDMADIKYRRYVRLRVPDEPDVDGDEDSSGMSLTTTILIIAGTTVGFGALACFSFYTYRFYSQKTAAGASSSPMAHFTEQLRYRVIDERESISNVYVTT